jgi:hypothetical protein
LKKIEKGKLKKVYLSIFGSPDSPDNKQIIARAKAMQAARKFGTLDVMFYSAETARVWS